MKSTILLHVFMLLLLSGLNAQSGPEVSPANICNFTESDLTIRTIHEFTSESEAIAVMNDITAVLGLKPNFIIQAANVPNAAAMVEGPRRYVYYSPKFIQSVRNSTHTNWSAISILAHEIGHHLNGHTLDREGSRPKTELEADEFSGFVLRKMGATLAEAQAAMRVLAGAGGSTTHPPRHLRLESIETGWVKADAMLGGGLEPAPVVAQNHPSSPPPANDLPAPAEMPRPEISLPAPATPAYAQWRVELAKNPDSYYYITKSNTFVVVKNGKAYTLGELRNTQSNKFPFVIKLQNSPDIIVNARGELLTQNGETVGALKKI